MEKCVQWHFYNSPILKNILVEQKIISLELYIVDSRETIKYIYIGNASYRNQSIERTRNQLQPLILRFNKKIRRHFISIK